MNATETTGGQTSDPPQTPLPDGEDRMEKARASPLAKRKERYKIARESVGDGNVNEFGSIKGIRMSVKNINTIKVEKCDVSSQLKHLKRLEEMGLIMDTSIRPPLELPTAEQVKQYEAKRAKLAEEKKKAHDDTSTARIPKGYCHFLGFKEGPRKYEIIRKCALLAMEDYNMQKGTKYRFVDVEKVGWKIYSYLEHYIIFQARTSEDSDTFEAKVIYRKIGRKNVCNGAISVLSVRITRPGSDWLEDNFDELVVA